MVSLPDLSCLNTAERAVLKLLAQGHTARSIAAATGRTEGAVNERLREARRKTGMGSSRELARLFAARESLDEKSGMAPGEAAPSPPDSVPPVVRQRKRVISMVLLSLIAAAAVMLHGSGQQAPMPPMPPTPPGASDRDPGATAATLRARFAGEIRDAAWATRMEAALMDRYRATGGADLATVTVACRSTLCSVQGQAVSPIANGRGRRFLDALASPAARGAVPGIHADVTDSSGFTRDGSYIIIFAALWRRTDRD